MTTTDWYGRKPLNLAPLTREWAISAMQPRYEPETGAILRSLTPPRRGSFGPWLRVLGIVVFILLVCAAATSPMWR